MAVGLTGSFQSKASPRIKDDRIVLAGQRSLNGRGRSLPWADMDIEPSCHAELQPISAAFARGMTVTCLFRGRLAQTPRDSHKPRNLCMKRPEPRIDVPAHCTEWVILTRAGRHSIRSFFCN